MGAFVIWGAIQKFIGLVPAFVWKWLAIAAIAAILFFAGEARGKRVEKEACEAAARAAQTAANTQDLQAEKDGREQDLQITNNLTQQKKVDDATIENLKRQIATRTPAAAKGCSYDKDNADPNGEPVRRRVLIPAKRPPGAGARDPNAP